MKTTELTGAALDWAAAKCEGEPVYSYSTNWLFGGPIIEREQISLVCMGDCWESSYNPRTESVYGDTPLIAAIRCYVTRKLGDEVDIPEELK